MEYTELLGKAKEAMKKAYTPYSEHKVGAALLAKDGTIITGCNIENAAYGPTICAERTAVVKAVSEGIKEFKAIAIVGGMHGVLKYFCSPCGVCRQVLREFVNPEEFDVVLEDGEGNVKVLKLAELLPMSFGPENLN